MSDYPNLQRAWINQPSSHDTLHHLHGTNVLAHLETDRVWKIYFLDGPVLSQQVPSTALSFGNWGF